jgi:kynureninase
MAALDLNAGKRWIVYDELDFPTDRYVIEDVGRRRSMAIEPVPRRSLIDALCDDTAVVVSSLVDYRTGEVLDMEELTAACHDHGALVLWDLSHAAGILPVELDACRCDFAVGCSYKYLNGGPGAPAWTYVADRHLDRVASPLPGWVGHADPFEMPARYEHAPGIRRMLTGTPAVLGLAALDAALDAFDGVSLADLRDVNISLTDLFITLVDEQLGWPVVSPRDAACRGGQVTMRHPQARAIVDALAQQHVIADARTTATGSAELLRFGFAPLYIRHADVWDAVDRLATLSASNG